jgi:hypothetical protein
MGRKRRSGAAGDADATHGRSTLLYGLTAAQRRFLAFHAATPAPHRWAWLQADGAPSMRPDDAAKLRAWRGFGSQLVATIDRDELRGLDRYFGPFPKVNADGLALLAMLRP